MKMKAVFAGVERGCSTLILSQSLSQIKAKLRTELKPEEVMLRVFAPTNRQ